ncbi:MAG: tRNA lysidine(34) synthetase TilS [Clostridia bacterium]|nr:tRNA lysidine(34) synthetase TilS [Clostridia bacterium]
MMGQLECLRQRLDPAPAGRCLAGVSGGADSVALLMLLRGLPGAEVEAVHVNHGLRGAESDGDEAFVRTLCERLGVPLLVKRLDLGGRRDENAAREARYGAFEAAMRERAVSTLVLAHQRDDQAETVLMRLLRGAGPEGLRGMGRQEKWKEYVILRPLLGISGGELRDALREEGILWREDGTNRETDYFRNRVRWELLPRLEEMAPGIAQRLCQTAALIGQDAEALRADAEKLLEGNSGPGWIHTAALAEAPEAVRSRAIRLWWERNGPRLKQRGLTYPQTQRLLAMLDKEPGATGNLPAGWRVRRRKDRLVLLSPAGERPESRKEEET